MLDLLEIGWRRSIAKLRKLAYESFIITLPRYWTKHAQIPQEKPYVFLQIVFLLLFMNLVIHFYLLSL
jgi:hypothetical protein